MLRSARSPRGIDLAAVSIGEHLRDPGSEPACGADHGAVRGEPPSGAAVDLAAIDVANPRAGLPRQQDSAGVIPDVVSGALLPPAIGDLGLAENHKAVLRLTLGTDEFAPVPHRLADRAARGSLPISCARRRHHPHGGVRRQRIARNHEPPRLSLVAGVERVRPTTLSLDRRDEDAAAERRVPIRRKDGPAPSKQRQARAPVAAIDVTLRAVDRIEHPHVLGRVGRTVERAGREEPRDVAVVALVPPIVEQRTAVRLCHGFAADRVKVLLGDRGSDAVRALEPVENEDLKRDIDGRHHRPVGLVDDRPRRKPAPRRARQIRGLVHEVGGEVERVEIDPEHRRRVAAARPASRPPVRCHSGRRL